MTARHLAGFAALLLGSGIAGSPGRASGVVIAPMTTASRTSGVAPLSVFFDCVDTTPSGVASPFTWKSGVFQPPDGDHEGLTYAWDFGDPASGTWATTNRSRNTASGYTAAHVYENPGTYTVSLSITDASGTVRTYVQTVTVSAFSGTTYYVAANGSDSNDGLSPSTPFLTAAKGLSMVGTKRAVLFRRGDTFAMGGNSKSIGVAGPGIIGAYGTGNRPVLTSTITGQDSSPITVAASDWRIMDLTIAGTGSNKAWGIQISTTTHTDNVLLLRLQTPGWNVGVAWSAYGPVLSNPHDGATVMACEVPSPGLNGMFLGGRRIALLGNDIHEVGSSHVLRMWMGHKAVVSNNRLWNPGPTRHALKLHGPGVGDVQPETRYVTISDNLIRGKTWSVAISPQNAQSDERVSHVVFERNRFWGEASVQLDMEISARHVMVRNNLFDGTGSASGYTAVSATQRGIEPAPLDVRVYNNTMVRLDPASSFTGLSVTPASQRIAYRNNLLSAPLASTKALVGGTGGAGFLNDHNLLIPAPGFTSADTGDYSLQTGSPAVDAGVMLWEVRSDFLGRPRPSGAACDVGAFER